MSLPNRTVIQVASDINFATILDEYDGEYTESYETPTDVFPKGTSLYIRGMHSHPDTGDSAWSSVTTIKLAYPWAVYDASNDPDWITLN